MPEQTRQVSKKESVQPTRGLLSRWFGQDPMTPQMEEGINIARKEMPDMAPVKSYGFFSRMLQPDAFGYASPGNSIYLNPRMSEGQTPQEVADTLVHEQEHIKQQKTSGVSPTMDLLKRMLIPQRTPYAHRPEEMSAFQVEKERRSRMGRSQTAIPSFTNPGQFYVPQDINLPSPRLKQR